MKITRELNGNFTISQASGISKEDLTWLIQHYGFLLEPGETISRPRFVQLIRATFDEIHAEYAVSILKSGKYDWVLA